MALRKFRFRNPYLSNGRTTLGCFQGISGVYLIAKRRKGSGKPWAVCYIGYSGSNLYKTIYRHFEDWNDKTQYRVSYRGSMRTHEYRVRVVACPAREAMDLEQALIKAYQPKDNVVKYEGIRDSQGNTVLTPDDKHMLARYERVKARQGFPCGK